MHYGLFCFTKITACNRNSRLATRKPLQWQRENVYKFAESKVKHEKVHDGKKMKSSMICLP